jgi:voltage-gated potassium channel
VSAGVPTAGPWLTLHAVLSPAGRSRSARLFRTTLRAIVALGLLAVILGTMPALEGSSGASITALTAAIALLFALEYLVRLCQAPLEAGGAARFETEPGARRRWSARTRWAASPLGLIDLAAAALIPAALIVGVSQASARLFGLVWILKLVRYSPALDMLGRVLREERQPLTSVLVAFLIVLVGAAAGAYLLERDLQPATFGSIPSALWWAIVTLTTTGYGDEVPASALGRILAGTVMLGGIALFALWAGILASGFARELRRREFLETWGLVARVPMFASLGAATIAEVARLLRRREVGARRAICRKGEAGDGMYFIVEGEVEVLLGANRPRLGPGDFFGELALINGMPRVATVVSRERTTLLVLDVADFRGLAAARPELLHAIEAEAARRQAPRADAPDHGVPLRE